MPNHFDELVNGSQVSPWRASIDEIGISKWRINADYAWLVRTVLRRKLRVGFRVMVQFQQTSIGIGTVIHRSRSRMWRNSKNANNLQHRLALQQLTYRVRKVEEHPRARATEKAAHDIHSHTFRDLQPAAHGGGFTGILCYFCVLFFNTP